MTHYRHSGRIDPKGLLSFGLVTVLVGPLFALIYAAATVYIPLIYVNLLLTIGFGAVVGGAVGLAMKAGHVRNTAVAAVVTMGAAFVAYYIHWVFWFGVHAFRADGSFTDAFALLIPPFLLEGIALVNEEGTWGIGSSGSAVSGAFLTVVWIAEAILFFGGAVVGAMAAAPSAYCERCATWCVPRDGVRRFGADSDGALAARLDGGDLAVLADAPPPEPDAPRWAQLDLEVCEGCGQTNTLTLKAVELKTDAKGNTSEKSDVLVDRLLLTPEQAQWVLAGSGPA